MRNQASSSPRVRSGDESRVSSAPRRSRSCPGAHRLVGLLVASVLLVAVGCGDREERTNVRPPAAGLPGAPSDVQGIYRTIHQGLLQLRGDGEFVLVVPEGPGPQAGTYTLVDGTLTVTTDKCGDAVGEYDVIVTGEQQAGKARIEFTTRRDECADRSYYLTIDPWIYADS